MKVFAAKTNKWLWLGAIFLDLSGILIAKLLHVIGIEEGICLSIKNVFFYLWIISCLLWYYNIYHYFKAGFIISRLVDYYHFIIFNELSLFMSRLVDMGPEIKFKSASENLISLSEIMSKEKTARSPKEMRAINKELRPLYSQYKLEYKKSKDGRNRRRHDRRT